uniref:Uncharacterized protein n=1 Tax=Chromera velia CCMP2878 TaxID=1169474 RepID=A0A0G4I6A7_9ALVE|eukprot:Cvel_11320.t1-p1 / transcript=Cvel_11320.t1 / gene=Cvel_11320 / organism=Chromera_velia_CCMP2878 / gene_product=hypothetical protein / transcript_product=hypothetical protein / location=Cvel_scaffold708:30074-41829(+) / protein_length=1117 / sequence_SO=supercontig / SO=protein_coding / is_pseudo=false
MVKYYADSEPDQMMGENSHGGNMEPLPLDRILQDLVEWKRHALRERADMQENLDKLEAQLKSLESLNETREAYNKDLLKRICMLEMAVIRERKRMISGGRYAIPQVHSVTLTKPAARTTELWSSANAIHWLLSEFQEDIRRRGVDLPSEPPSEMNADEAAYLKRFAAIAATDARGAPFSLMDLEQLEQLPIPPWIDPSLPRPFRKARFLQETRYNQETPERKAQLRQQLLHLAAYCNKEGALGAALQHQQQQRRRMSGDGAALLAGGGLQDHHRGMHGGSGSSSSSSSAAGGGRGGPWGPDGAGPPHDADGGHVSGPDGSSGEGDEHEGGHMRDSRGGRDRLQSQRGGDWEMDRQERERERMERERDVHGERDNEDRAEEARFDQVLKQLCADFPPDISPQEMLKRVQEFHVLTLRRENEAALRRKEMERRDGSVPQLSREEMENDQKAEAFNRGMSRAIETMGQEQTLRIIRDRLCQILVERGSRQHQQQQAGRMRGRGGSSDQRGGGGHGHGGDRERERMADRGGGERELGGVVPPFPGDALGPSASTSSSSTAPSTISQGGGGVDERGEMAQRRAQRDHRDGPSGDPGAALPAPKHPHSGGASHGGSEAMDAEGGGSWGRMGSGHQHQHHGHPRGAEGARRGSPNAATGAGGVQAGGLEGVEGGEASRKRDRELKERERDREKAEGIHQSLAALWQLPEPWKPYRSLSHLDSVRCLDFEDSTRTLASVGEDGLAKLWDCSKMEFIWTDEISHRLSQDSWKSRAKPEEYDPFFESYIAFRDGSRPLLCCTWAEKQHLLCAGEDGQIRAYHAPPYERPHGYDSYAISDGSGHQARRFSRGKVGRPMEAVWAMATSKAERIVAAGSADGRVTLYACKGSAGGAETGSGGGGGKGDGLNFEEAYHTTHSLEEKWMVFAGRTGQRAGVDLPSSLSWHPRDQMLCVGFVSGEIVGYDFKEQDKEVWKVFTLDDADPNVRQTTAARVWRSKDGSAFGPTLVTDIVALSGSQGLVLTSHLDGYARLYDVRMKKNQSIKVGPQEVGVSSADADAALHNLILTTADGCIYQYDPRNAVKEVNKLKLHKQKNGEGILDFCWVGETAITAGADGNVWFIRVCPKGS